MYRQGLLRDIGYLRQLVSAYDESCFQININGFGATVTQLN